MSLPKRVPRSTLVAVPLAVLLLAVLVGFVALAPDDTDGSGRADALPEGFAEIPQEVFFDRVFGAQRAAGSWHFDKERVSSGIARLASLDSEVAGDFVNASGTVQYLRDDGALQTLQVRLIEGVYYVTGLGASKKWWQIDPDAGKIESSVREALEQIASQDTSENLQDAVSEVEVVGEDLVEGAVAARYRVTLLEPETEQEATVDVWVDRDDRPVKIVTKVDIQGTAVTSTSVYSDYGGDFDIAPPPADQTTTEAPETAAADG